MSSSPWVGSALRFGLVRLARWFWLCNHRRGDWSPLILYGRWFWSRRRRGHFSPNKAYFLDPLPF